MHADTTTDRINAAITLAKAGNREEAMRLFRGLATEFPQLDTVWVWCATLTGDNAEAVEYLERAFQVTTSKEKVSERLIRALISSGTHYAKIKDVEKARRDFFRVIDLNSQNEIAWLWLAELAPDPHTATVYLEQVLKINPNNRQAQMVLATVKERGKTVRKTRCPFCSAEIHTTDTQCGGCRSILHLSRITEAINNSNSNQQLLRTSISRLHQQHEAKPTFTTAYFLGMALANLGEFSDALYYFDAARSYQPDNAAFAEQLRTARMYEQHLKRTDKPLDQDEDSIFQEGPSSSGSLMIDPEELPAIPVWIPPKGRPYTLLVEHSPTFRALILKTLLEQERHVGELSDGNMIGEFIAQHGAPELLLLDADYSKVDANETTTSLLSQPQLAELPVIIMSSEEGFVYSMKSRMAGAREHLSKPFIEAELVRAIRLACQPIRKHDYELEAPPTAMPISVSQ
ncbi:MAG: response regulator [Zavarzinella sp.]